MEDGYLTSCVCCSLLTGCILGSLTVSVLYLVAFSLEILWIIQEEVQLPIPGYFLTIVYICLGVSAAGVVYGLKTKRTRLLASWMVFFLLSIIPEGGLVLYMAIYYWKGGPVGVFELSFWLIRALVSVISTLCLHSLFSRWREEKTVEKSLKRLHLVSSGALYPPNSSKFGYENEIFGELATVTPSFHHGKIGLQRKRSNSMGMPGVRLINTNSLARSHSTSSNLHRISAGNLLAPLSAQMPRRPLHHIPRPRRVLAPGEHRVATAGHAGLSPIRGHLSEFDPMRYYNRSTMASISQQNLLIDQQHNDEINLLNHHKRRSRYNMMIPSNSRSLWDLRSPFVGEDKTTTTSNVSSRGELLRHSKSLRCLASEVERRLTKGRRDNSNGNRNHRYYRQGNASGGGGGGGGGANRGRGFGRALSMAAADMAEKQRQWGSLPRPKSNLQSYRPRSLVNLDDDMSSIWSGVDPQNASTVRSVLSDENVKIRRVSRGSPPDYNNNIQEGEVRARGGGGGDRRMQQSQRASSIADLLTFEAEVLRTAEDSGEDEDEILAEDKRRRNNNNNNHKRFSQERNQRQRGSSQYEEDAEENSEEESSWVSSYSEGEEDERDRRYRRNGSEVEYEEEVLEAQPERMRFHGDVEEDQDLFTTDRFRFRKGVFGIKKSDSFKNDEMSSPQIRGGQRNEKRRKRVNDFADVAL